MGSREVRLTDVQPGWTLVTSGPTVAPGTVIAQPVAEPPASSALSGIDATGIVGQVDARTGTITLQDGRIVRVTPGTTVWQPVTIGSVMPGASVFVRNAEPLDFRPTTSPAAARPYQMETVSSVDASNARGILSDGTVVHLRPGARATFNGQSLAISDLRPGDEIVVGLPAGSAVSVTPGSAVSALPHQTAGRIDGEYIYVVRRPQAP